MTRRLGVGFIGSGFMTRFHIRSWQAVRDGDVRGVWSPNGRHAEEAAALARELGVGEARAFPTLENQLFAPAVEARQGRRVRAGPPLPGGPIWREPPRNMAGRTCRGSGAATCRVAAC